MKSQSCSNRNSSSNWDRVVKLQVVVAKRIFKPRIGLKDKKENNSIP